MTKVLIKLQELRQRICACSRSKANNGQRNEDQTIDLAAGESFVFLGFEWRMTRTHTGKWRSNFKPCIKKKKALLTELKEVFRRNISQKLAHIRDKINPILRGWMNYFRVNHSTKVFSQVRYLLNLGYAVI